MQIKMIQDSAKQASEMGLPKYNVYPSHSLEFDAYETGFNLGQQ
jgi:hypothetical protein